MMQRNTVAGTKYVANLCRAAEGQKRAGGDRFVSGLSGIIEDLKHGGLDVASVRRNEVDLLRVGRRDA